MSEDTQSYLLDGETIARLYIRIGRNEMVTHYLTIAKPQTYTIKDISMKLVTTSSKFGTARSMRVLMYSSPAELSERNGMVSPLLTVKTDVKPFGTHSTIRSLTVQVKAKTVFFATFGLRNKGM